MFRVALKNVVLNWRLSFAALTSVVTTFMCLTLFQGYIRGVDQIYNIAFDKRFMYGDLIIDNPTDYGERPRLDIYTQAKINEFNIRNESDVLYVAKFLLIFGQISNENHTTIFSGRGYTVDEAAKIRSSEWAWNTLAGVPLQNSTEKFSVLFGRLLAERFGCFPESQEKYLNGRGGYKAIDRPFSCRDKEFQFSIVSQLGQMRTLDAKIVGIVDAAYKELDKTYISFPLNVAQLLDGSSDVTYYTIKMKSPDSVDKYINAFNKVFSVDGLAARRWQDHPEAQMYVKTISLLNTFRNFVVLIVILISGFSIFNSFLKIVKERTREMGTLRAYGFSKFHLRQLIFLEASILSFIGTIIGLVLSYLFCILINNLSILYRAGVLTEPVPFIIKPHYWTFILSAVLILMVSTIAALIPLNSLLKKTANENLNEL